MDFSQAVVLEIHMGAMGAMAAMATEDMVEITVDMVDMVDIIATDSTMAEKMFDRSISERYHQIYSQYLLYTLYRI